MIFATLASFETAATPVTQASADTLPGSPEVLKECDEKVQPCFQMHFVFNEK